MIDKRLNYGRDIIKSFLINSSPFTTVLDIGAGNGEDLNVAYQINKNAHLHAIEYLVEYAIKLESQNIKVWQLNIERDSFPFLDENVDIIIANQILEHVKELFWILHEMSRITAIGGKIIIGVPNLASLHNRLLLLLGRQPTPIQLQTAHVRGFTLPGLNKFFESCWPGGYELLDFKGSNFYPFPPVMAKPLARIFPSLAWGIFMLYQKKRRYNDEFLKYPAANKLETNFFLGEG
jgi:SAM-dependent methyltransferase